MRQGLPGFNIAKVTPFIEPTKKNEEKFMEYKEFERIISAKRIGRFFLHVTQSEAKSLGNIKVGVHGIVAPQSTQSSTEV